MLTDEIFKEEPRRKRVAGSVVGLMIAGLIDAETGLAALRKLDQPKSPEQVAGEQRLNELCNLPLGREAAE